MELLLWSILFPFGARHIPCGEDLNNIIKSRQSHLLAILDVLQGLCSGLLYPFRN